MSDAVKALLARMEDQRKTWCELGDGKSLQYLRPQEVEMPDLAGGVFVEHVIRFACGWRGFTEADLLPDGVGGDAVVPFDRELCAAVVRDNAQYIEKATKAIAATVSQYLVNQEATRKN